MNMLSYLWIWEHFIICDTTVGSLAGPKIHMGRWTGAPLVFTAATVQFFFVLTPLPSEFETSLSKCELQNRKINPILKFVNIHASSN